MSLTPPQEAVFLVARSLLMAGRESLMPETSLPKRGSEVIAADDRVPQFGFVGDDYESCGILVLGINPGNGPDNARSPSDAEMMPFLHQFAVDPSESTFAAAMKAQMRAFPCWLASKEIGPILRNENVKESEIAYANASPYRAGNGEAKDVFPNKMRQRVAAKEWVLPLISALNPRLIIAHAKKAAEVLGFCNLETRSLVYNRNHNQRLRSAANVEFVEKLRLALGVIAKAKLSA